jgi:hypothetical protein
MQRMELLANKRAVSAQEKKIDACENAEEK